MIFTHADAVHAAKAATNQVRELLDATKYADVRCKESGRVAHCVVVINGKRQKATIRLVERSPGNSPYMLISAESITMSKRHT